MVSLSSMTSKPVFLDVDPSIVESNLRFVRANEEEQLNKLLGTSSTATAPSKVIKPWPGLCVKTREVGTEKKVFLNVCQTDAIPAPRDVSESEVIDLMRCTFSEGECDFKVPMSIGSTRKEIDNKGEEVTVCDVAVNKEFFKRLETMPYLRKFFFCILFEGLREKHSLFCTDNAIVLKNKKVHGSLQTHVIQDREVEEKMGLKKQASTIEVLQGRESHEKPKIQILDSQDVVTRIPDYRLYTKKDDDDVLYGEFKLPDVLNASTELTLDVGLDRILLESKTKGYLVDIFLPIYVNQNETVSTFDKLTKILTVVMPVIEFPAGKMGIY